MAALAAAALVALCVPSALAAVTVLSTNLAYADQVAAFGPPVPDSGVWAAAVSLRGLDPAGEACVPAVAAMQFQRAAADRAVADTTMRQGTATEAASRLSGSRRPT